MQIVIGFFLTKLGNVQSLLSKIMEMKEEEILHVRIGTFFQFVAFNPMLSILNENNTFMLKMFCTQWV